MVYTLASYLRESLAELLVNRNARIQKAEDERIRIAEEVRLLLFNSSCFLDTDNEINLGGRYQNSRNKSNTRLI